MTNYAGSKVVGFLHITRFIFNGYDYDYDTSKGTACSYIRLTHNNTKLHKTKPRVKKIVTQCLHQSCATHFRSRRHETMSPRTFRICNSDSQLGPQIVARSQTLKQNARLVSHGLYKGLVTRGQAVMIEKYSFFVIYYQFSVKPSTVYDKLKSDKSPGLKGWPILAIKESAKNLCLYHFAFCSPNHFNLHQCLRYGNRHLLPLFTKGECCKAENYHPISLTSTIVKIQLPNLSRQLMIYLATLICSQLQPKVGKGSGKGKNMQPFCFVFQMMTCASSLWKFLPYM